MSVAIASKTHDRHYNPDTGRFLSEDPIHFFGDDWNLYRYTYNNPQGFVDRDGRKPSPADILDVYDFVDPNPGASAGAIIGGGVGLVLCGPYCAFGGGVVGGAIGGSLTPISGELNYGEDQNLPPEMGGPRPIPFKPIKPQGPNLPIQQVPSNPNACTVR